MLVQKFWTHRDSIVQETSINTEIIHSSHSISHALEMSLCCWVFQFCTGLWLSLVHPNPSPWNPCMVYLPRSTIKSTIFRQKNTIHGWYRILFWKKIRMPETHSAADLQRVSVFQTIPMLHCRHWYLGKHFHPAEAVEGFNPSSLGEGVGEGEYPSL